MNMLPINYIPGFFTQQYPQLAQLQLEALVANEVASKAPMNIVRLEMNNIIASENFQGPITNELMTYVINVVSTLINSRQQFNAADKVSACVLVYCARLMSRMGHIINQETPNTIQQFNQAAMQLGPELDMLAMGQIPQVQPTHPSVSTGMLMSHTGGVHPPAMGQATTNTYNTQLSNNDRRVMVNSRSSGSHTAMQRDVGVVTKKSKWGGTNTHQKPVEEHNPLMKAATSAKWGSGSKSELQAGFRFTTEPKPEPVTVTPQPVVSHVPDLSIPQVFDSQNRYVEEKMGGNIPKGTIIADGCYYFPASAVSVKYETYIGYFPFASIGNNKPKLVYIAEESLMDYNEHSLKPQAIALHQNDIQAKEVIEATGEKPLSVFYKSINQKKNPYRSGSFEWKNIPQRLALWYGSKSKDPYVISYKARLEDKICIDTTDAEGSTMLDIISSLDLNRGPAVFFNNAMIDPLVKEFAARRLEPFVSNYIYKALGETVGQPNSLEYESALGDWGQLIELLCEDYGSDVRDDFNKILRAACRFTESKPGAVTEDMIFAAADSVGVENISDFDQYNYIVGVTAAMKICTSLTADELGFHEDKESGYISEHTHHYLYSALTSAFDDEFLQSVNVSNVYGLTVTVSRPATGMRMRWTLVESESADKLLTCPEETPVTEESDAE